MNNTRPNSQMGPGRNRRSADFLTLSNRILEGADGDTTLVCFLKDVSELILQFSGCDVIRMVLHDHDRRYRTELNRRLGQPFRFDETVQDGGRRNELNWSSDDNADLERLCREVAAGRSDSTKPWCTPNGSLWTGDTGSLPSGELRPSDSSPGLGMRISNDTGSVAIIAVEAGTERVGLLELESVDGEFFVQRQIESYEFVCQSLGIALAHRKLQGALGERIKELTCLYGIAKLAAQPELALEEVLLRTAESLPQGWLHPEVCCARIVLDDRVHATRGYRKPRQTMRAGIAINGKERGFVEVGYVWERPLLDEGPFLNEERNLINGVAHEVSILVEQRQAEREKLRLHEQLLHADRLATIGQLGAGLAHELNEPLANILGFAQLVAKDESLQEQTRQDVSKIVSASLHAREVIAKLLVFARDTAPARVQTDLNVVIEEGLHFFASRCAKVGVELSYDLTAGLPTIMADHSQLLQILTNLVVNSIQAMPGGGRLTIATDLDEGYIRLVVEDSGTGMASDVQQRIFEPFFTTKDVDEGTGLGLSVVHGIVTAHGGTIDVESEVDLGSRFVVRLPIDAPDPQGRPIND